MNFFSKGVFLNKRSDLLDNR